MILYIVGGTIIFACIILFIVHNFCCKNLEMGESNRKYTENSSTAGIKGESSIIIVDPRQNSREVIICSLCHVFFVGEKSGEISVEFSGTEKKRDPFESQSNKKTSPSDGLYLQTSKRAQEIIDSSHHDGLHSREPSNSLLEYDFHNLYEGFDAGGNT